MNRLPALKIACVYLLSAAIATQADAKTAPVPAPPPPPVVVAPPAAIAPAPVLPYYKPYSPGGAAITMKMPGKNADGSWITPNQNLSVEESIWNFRSAINVAALTCKGLRWDAITDNYNQMLTQHSERLSQANTRLDAEYVKRFPGQNALRVRDARSTALYNYFAMPPVKQQYCDMALAKSTEMLNVTPIAFPGFASRSLAQIDALYSKFFDDFTQYKIDIANWYIAHPEDAPVVKAPPVKAVKGKKTIKKKTTVTVKKGVKKKK